MRHLIRPFVLALLLLQAPLAMAQTQPDPPRAAESADSAAFRLNEEGKKLVALGKYEEALDKFREALKLFPLSNAIFNVGSMYYTLRHYEDAYPFLNETLRAPLDPRQRQIVLNYLENVLVQVRLSHSETNVETSPPGATIAINGKELPFKTPTKVLVPFGAADLNITLEGFKPQMVVVNSSRTEAAKPMALRLERDEPDAAVSVRCPAGADIFIDGQMQGFELVRTKLLIGKHVVRCGKTKASAAFERNVQVRSGPNAFEFSQATK